MENNEIIESIYFSDGTYYDDSKTNHLSHFHQCYECMFITKGELDVTVDKKHYHAVPGDVLIFSNLEMHDVIISKTPYHRYILRLYVSPTESVLSNTHLISLFKYHTENFNHCIHLSHVLDDAINLFEKILKEFESEEKEPFRYDLIGSYIKELTIFLYRNSDISVPQIKSNLYTQIYLIQKYIDNNYSNNISIEKLAKDNFMSHNHMTHTFKDHTGLSPRQYLTLVRLNAASRMLTTTDDSVLNIALSCGFSDINNFMKCFKQKFNMTPNKYRKAIIDNNNYYRNYNNT